MDLSAGRYQIKNILVNGCIDKGISLGEKGILYTDFVSIKNSDTGLVSKDSSLATINKALIRNVKKCFSVYRKKQEFGGAKIVFPTKECVDSPFDVQQLSSLEDL